MHEIHVQCMLLLCYITLYILLLVVAGQDYAAVTGDELMFNYGEIRTCYTVSILQDSVCENTTNKVFFSDLAYVSGLQPTIDPSTVQVFIDDTEEPECSKKGTIHIMSLYMS